jgi:DNA-binding HxlR family transcriptional regulator/putative sterol carrier protein
VRSYRQFCPAARALDVVGERWALLIVRELLLGPRRYSDLKAGLPGIGPTVLSERLRALEEACVVHRKRLAPPAASTVYVLSERGQALRPVLSSLFEWGLRLLDAPGADDTVRASYWVPALQAGILATAASRDHHDVFEFRVGEDRITVENRRGEVVVRDGFAEDPDVVVATDAHTFAKLGMGRLSAADAVASGSMSVEGDPVAVERCAELFGAAAGPPPPA